MTIKIDAPRRYMSDGCAYANKANAPGAIGAVRLVSEPDWRKLMKLVREVDDYIAGCERVSHYPYPLIEALDALKEKAK